MTATSGHLVIATGGTGGHFYPALAVARAFQRQGGVVSLFIAGQRTEIHIEEARKEGFVAFACPAFRLPRSPMSALTFLPRILWGVIKARSMIKNLKADFVLGMGSFASFPACMAAGLSGIPMFIHDGNAVVGQANRFLSRWANCLALSLPLAPGEKARCKTRITGMPVRSQILQAIAVPPDRRTLLADLGLDEKRKTVLVFGGSQGAAFINGLIQEAIPSLGALPLQIIHLTGCEENEELIRCYKQVAIPAVVAEYSSEIEKLYTAADFVVCRSGGGTIAELALFGRPPVLIPIPGSSLDHQHLNAMVLQKADAAVTLDQETVTASGLVETVKSFFDYPEAWIKRGENIHKFGSPRSASAIVDMIYVETGKKGWL